MIPSVRAPKDFWIGIIYLAVGAAALWFGRGYAFGTGARMGPGYFPTVVAWLLLLFGAAAILRSLLVPGEPVGQVAWKGLALVVGGTALFALTLERLGLIVAILLLGGVSAAASDRFAPNGRVLVGLALLVAACALVFVIGLGLPMPLVGPWLTGLVPAGRG